MNKQLSMSFVQDELAEVKTNKTAFLEQMNRLVPWAEWGKKSTDGVWRFKKCEIGQPKQNDSCHTALIYGGDSMKHKLCGVSLEVH